MAVSAIDQDPCSIFYDSRLEKGRGTIAHSADLIYHGLVDPNIAMLLIRCQFSVKETQGKQKSY